jgi:hypothetical protein
MLQELKETAFRARERQDLSSPNVCGKTRIIPRFIETGLNYQAIQSHDNDGDIFRYFKGEQNILT